MDKRKQVKDTCDKLAIKMIEFINKSGLDDEECSSIMYEISASFFTCATVTQVDEKDDVERVADNIPWFIDSVLEAIFKVYHGNSEDFIEVGEDEDD